MLTEAIRFLRSYGNLKDRAMEPRFTAWDLVNPTADEDVVEYIPGRWRYQSDYERLRLPAKTERDFELEIYGIPDGALLLDIGSGLGKRLTRRFAEERRGVEVVLVDCMTEARLRREALHNKSLQRLTGRQGNIEERVNRTFQEDGLCNIRFIHKELSLDDYALDAPDRPLYVTGFRNDCGLGNITVRIAEHYGAERLWLSNSSLEEIPTGSAHFRPMRQMLAERMEPAEIDGIIGRLNFPIAAYMHRPVMKYDYSEEGVKEFCKALKLPFVWAQKVSLEKHGYTVQVFDNAENRYYNQPDQLVYAEKI